MPCPIVNAQAIAMAQPIPPHSFERIISSTSAKTAIIMFTRLLNFNSFFASSIVIPRFWMSCTNMEQKNRRAMINASEYSGPAHNRMKGRPKTMNPDRIKHITVYWMRPVLINKSDNSLLLLSFVTIAVTFGRKTEDIAVEHWMYIPWSWMATANTDTAIVPDIAPNTNWPVLQ